MITPYYQSNLFKIKVLTDHFRTRPSQQSFRPWSNSPASRWNTKSLPWSSSRSSNVSASSSEFRPPVGTTELFATVAELHGSSEGEFIPIFHIHNFSRHWLLCAWNRNSSNFPERGSLPNVRKLGSPSSQELHLSLAVFLIFRQKLQSQRIFKAAKWKRARTKTTKKIRKSRRRKKNLVQSEFQSVLYRFFGVVKDRNEQLFRSEAVQMSDLRRTVQPASQFEDASEDSFWRETLQMRHMLR